MKCVVKHFLDVALTVLLILLMSYQVTGEKTHEWLGVLMPGLVIVHNALNFKWYSSIAKGRYNAVRALITAVDLLLIISMLTTAVSGILMNSFILPLHISGTMAAARLLHLSCSHWSFVLMGLHIGLHWTLVLAMFRKIKLRDSAKKRAVIAARVAALAVAGYGAYCFVKADMPSYMTFKTHFAFLDYERPAPLVFADNLAMLGTWAAMSYYLGKLLKCKKKVKDK